MPFCARSKFSIFPTLHLRIARRFAPLKDSWHDDRRERPVHCGPRRQSWRDAGYKQHARVRTGPQIEHRKLDTLEPVVEVSSRLCLSEIRKDLSGNEFYCSPTSLLRCPLPCPHFCCVILPSRSRWKFTEAVTSGKRKAQSGGRVDRSRIQAGGRKCAPPVLALHTVT